MKDEPIVWQAEEETLDVKPIPFSADDYTFALMQIDQRKWQQEVFRSFIIPPELFSSHR